MSYVTEQIAQTLKKTRESRGLSQRALSEKAGVPQSHISKIESGTVDLRLSSLIELARALDLELTLVPRKTIPAVQSIVRSSIASTLQNIDKTGREIKELNRTRQTLANFTATQQATTEFAQLQRQLQDLQHFRLDDEALKSIRNAQKTLEKLGGSDQISETLRQLNSQFKGMRNVLAHNSATPETDSVRPAYTLDEDDNV